METPPHDVYFPSEVMQMEGAAKARYDGKYCLSSSLSLGNSIKGIGLENCSRTSQEFLLSPICFAVFE